MRRYTEKARTRILGAYARFDGSQASFFRESDVRVSTLQYWLRGRRARETQDNGFVEVQSDVVDPKAMIVRAAGAENVFAAWPEPEYLAQVIRALA